MSARLESALAELADAIREEMAEQAAAQLGAPDRLLTVEQAADALSIGRSFAYQQITAGRLRSLKVGRRRLVPSSALAEFAASPVNTTAAATTTPAQARAAGADGDGGEA